MKILIIGPYPPPYGGISNHIFRIIPFLQMHGLEYQIFNQYDYTDESAGVYSTRSSYSWWCTFLFRRQTDFVHFHQFSWFHFFYLFVFSIVNSNRFFVTIHNEKLLKVPGFVQWTMVRLLKYTRCRKIFVVSKNIERLLFEANVKNVLYLPAYVPPVVSPKVKEKSSQITVFFNVWKIQNQDSIAKYGVDLLLDLASTYPEIRFECFVASEENVDLLRQLLLDRSINNCVIKIGENLVEHFYRADIFLRLNRDDAFGVSIQEAMDSGVPAIASNVCARPVGAQLFESGSIDDLISLFSKVLSSSKEELLNNKVTTSYHLKLIEIYRKNLVLK